MKQPLLLGLKAKIQLASACLPHVCRQQEQFAWLVPSKHCVQKWMGWPMCPPPMLVAGIADNLPSWDSFWQRRLCYRFKLLDGLMPQLCDIANTWSVGAMPDLPKVWRKCSQPWPLFCIVEAHWFGCWAFHIFAMTSQNHVCAKVAAHFEFAAQ